MKGVLFAACVWAILGSAGATCYGPACAAHCIGNLCAENCVGDYCGGFCTGKHCAVGCTEETQGYHCDASCYHFENEACSSKGPEYGITMGPACNATNLLIGSCERKNHPAVWQALKDTESANDEIILPKGNIEQCYYDFTDGCKQTNDQLPPLVCLISDRMCTDTENYEVLEYQKCNNNNQCGICQGICEQNSDCKGDLTCFLRNGTETVPGCTKTTSWTTMDVPGKGYCADTSTTDSSTLNDGDIAAIVIGVIALLAACALAWCYRTKQGFFGSSSSTAEPIKF